MARVAQSCYIIMRPCFDTYYDGHPTGEVFLHYESALERLKELNGEPDPTVDDSAWAYYIRTGELK